MRSPRPVRRAEDEEHDAHGADTAGDPEPLQAIDTRRERDAEENAEEPEEEDGPAEPQQLERDVDSGDDGGGAQDVARPPAGLAGLRGGAHRR